jgi:hypothetical protein
VRSRAPSADCDGAIWPPQRFMVLLTICLSLSVCDSLIAPTWHRLVSVQRPAKSHLRPRFPFVNPPSSQYTVPQCTVPFDKLITHAITRHLHLHKGQLQCRLSGPHATHGTIITGLVMSSYLLYGTGTGTWHQRQHGRMLSPAFLTQPDTGCLCSHG